MLRRKYIKLYSRLKLFKTQSAQLCTHLCLWQSLLILCHKNVNISVKLYNMHVWELMKCHALPWAIPAMGYQFVLKVSWCKWPMVALLFIQTTQKLDQLLSSKPLQTALLKPSNMYTLFISWDWLGQTGCETKYRQNEYKKHNRNKILWWYEHKSQKTPRKIIAPLIPRTKLPGDCH